MATSERLVALVDLDGTLIEFAPTPAEAVLDDRAAEVLCDLDREVVGLGRDGGIADLQGREDLWKPSWWELDVDDRTQDLGDATSRSGCGRHNARGHIFVVRSRQGEAHAGRET